MRYSMMFTVVFLAVAMAWGQGPATREVVATRETPPATAAATPAGSDKPVVTEGQVKIGDDTLRYKATAGLMPLKDEAGKLRANIFYIAYVKTDDAGNPPAGKRPLMFLFNGGPGAAAVWLHMGAAGPKRLATAEDGAPLSAPARVVDNPQTWLADADLVFIDPVSTGYSRAATPEQAKEFHGFSEDVAAVAEFIRLYVTKSQRWDSPKFLAGESYGTTRAAGLAEHLQERVGMSVSGVVLVSTVLNFAVLSPGNGNDLPYSLYLPSYTAAAWYHKKLPADLQLDLAKTLKEVEAFAEGDYAVALTKGDRLADAPRAAIAEKVARYTGLTLEYVTRVNLRIDPARFEKELLRADGKIIGRFDSRRLGSPLDPGNDSAEYDPSLTEFKDGYTEAFSAYVRSTLKYENDASYEVLTGKVFPWNFTVGGHGGGGNGYLYVGDNLRNAMTTNPNLKVLVCQGRFDLATPYFSADYQVAHMGLAKELRGSITQSYYSAGHMMYHQRAGLAQLHQDVARLIQSAIPAPASAP